MAGDQVRTGMGTEVFTASAYLRTFVANLSTLSESMMAMNPNSPTAISSASTFRAFTAQIQNDILNQPEGEQERLLTDLAKKIRGKLEGRRIPERVTPGMECEEVVTLTTSRILSDLEAIVSQLILDRAR